MSPLTSVVIPAHNEEAVLGRCLDSLMTGAADGELDVIVVANACTDRTADVAHRPGVRVVVTQTPGKTPALRLGDSQCQVFPRIYLDADIEVSMESIRAMVTALEAPGIIACAPQVQWHLSQVSPLVQRWHKVHDALMGPHRALAGVGVYALSEDGHARAFPLPDVVSDDEWVHRCFLPAERVVVATARSVVRPPRTMRAHLQRRLRVRRGNHQLAQLGRLPADGAIRLADLRELIARRAVSALDAAWYVLVTVSVRVLGATTRPDRSQRGWGRDATTRG